MQVSTLYPLSFFHSKHIHTLAQTRQTENNKVLAMAPVPVPGSHSQVGESFSETQACKSVEHLSTIYAHLI
jgi:hypothetical protein